MKKLSKQQQTKKNDIAEKMRTKIEELETVITEFNERRQRDFDETVVKVTEELNATLAEARSLQEEVTADQNSYYDNRNEKWQESDAGAAYSEWRYAWEDLYLDDVILDDVQEVEVPNTPIPEELETLTDEADSE